jgi:biopolymer transport protein ExbD
VNFRAGPSGVRRRAATVVDITALVDVVFQLLIFFLLTSSYVSQSTPKAPQVPVDLPESSLEAAAMEYDDFAIAVDAEGNIFVGADERVSLEELRVRLLKAANDNPRTVVLIRGDQRASYGRIAQVMEIARASRLKISAQLRGAN